MDGRNQQRIAAAARGRKRSPDKQWAFRCMNNLANNHGIPIRKPKPCPVYAKCFPAALT